MQDKPRNRLDEIRARVEAATKGPWEWRDGNGLCTLHDRGYYQYGASVLHGEHDYDSGCHIKSTDEDAEFIAHSREDIPHLLSLLDRAVDLLDECRIASHGVVHAEIAAFLDEVKR